MKTFVKNVLVAFSISCCVYLFLFQITKGFVDLNNQTHRALFVFSCFYLSCIILIALMYIGYKKNR